MMNYSNQSYLRKCNKKKNMLLVEDYSCYFTLDLQHTCWSFIDIHLHLKIQGKTQK